MADGSHAVAGTGGNSDTAIDIGNNTGTGEFALAGIGNNDFSFVDADNSSAYSGGDLLDSNLPGSNDVAIVFDPFGAGGDNVVSGINDLNPGNFDLGAILFDDNVLNTGASGADYLYDIVTTLGIESNSFAAASTDFGRIVCRCSSCPPRWLPLVRSRRVRKSAGDLPHRRQADRRCGA